MSLRILTRNRCISSNVFGSEILDTMAIISVFSAFMPPLSLYMVIIERVFFSRKTT